MVTDSVILYCIIKEISDSDSGIGRFQKTKKILILTFFQFTDSRIPDDN